MLDIDDWMLSCNKQINQFRKNQFQNFWTHIFSNDLPFITGAKSSTLSEEGGKSGGAYSGKDYGCDEE